VSSRAYPDRPFVGVGAVIVQGGRVVLIKRRFEPLAGHWSLPGGAVDVGETLVECVAREMLEETGLVVEVGPVLEVFDRIVRDDDGRVRFTTCSWTICAARLAARWPPAPTWRKRSWPIRRARSGALALRPPTSSCVVRISAGARGLIDTR
jgi:ADP-ribose pyrophosphatase YjhB (NUDIX family)